MVRPPPIPIQPGDHGLTVIHVPLPNPITTHYYKLIITQLTMNLRNVGLTRNHQPIPCLSLRLLVVEVPETTGEVQPPIHPPIYDLPSRLLNPLLLSCTLRLVIIRQGIRITLPREHRTGITRIGRDYLIGSDQDHAGCAASPQVDQIVAIARSVVLLPDDLQLLLALLTLDDLVDLSEGLIKCLHIPFLFVKFI